MKPLLASVLILVALSPRLAHGDQPEAGIPGPVYLAPAPPPAKYAKLAWSFDGVSAPGYWYTEGQVLAIDRRIEFLERACSQAQVDAKIATAKNSMPPWVWIVSGVVVGGAATWATMRLAR